MLLNEFFGRAVKSGDKTDKDLDKHKSMHDDLFWYIIDHDKIHKDYFFPIAKKIKTLKECGPEMILELYMPMVEKGCKEYYSYHKMNGRLGKIFNKEMREAMCQRLHDHFYDDVTTDKYKLG